MWGVGNLNLLYSNYLWILFTDGFPCTANSRLDLTSSIFSIFIAMSWVWKVKWSCNLWCCSVLMQYAVFIKLTPGNWYLLQSELNYAQRCYLVCYRLNLTLFTNSFLIFHEVMPKGQKETLQTTEWSNGSVPTTATVFLFSEVFLNLSWVFFLSLAAFSFIWNKICLLTATKTIISRKKGLLQCP